MGNHVTRLREVQSEDGNKAVPAITAKYFLDEATKERRKSILDALSSRDNHGILLETSF